MWAERPHAPLAGRSRRAGEGHSNPGQAFEERRTGLDHMSFAVASRADLNAWASWLDSQGVENSGVVDTGDPVPTRWSSSVIQTTSSSSSSTWPGDNETTPARPGGHADVMHSHAALRHVARRVPRAEPTCEPANSTGSTEGSRASALGCCVCATQPDADGGAWSALQAGARRAADRRGYALSSDTAESTQSGRYGFRPSVVTTS